MQNKNPQNLVRRNSTGPISTYSLPLNLRRSRRGVSPIIATILLVAITVVLAAVLYILVTGLLGGHTSVTSAMTMTASKGGSCTAVAVVENTYTITIGGVTATTTTANFGISLTQASATAATAAGTATTAASGTCYATPGANGWFAILMPAGSTGTNWAIYSGAGWQQCTGSPTAPCTALATLATPVTISGGQSILITATSAVTLTEATVSVFGTSGASITGSVTL